MTDLAGLADLPGIRGLATPAALIVEDAVRRNIASTVALIGSAHGWRPHIKTIRSAWGIGLLRDAGVTRFKASTVAEVAALAAAEAPDILLAVPAVGPAQHAAVALAEAGERSDAASRIAVLVDSIDALATWTGRIDAFIDVDTGMGRTGIPSTDVGAVLALAAALERAGHRFRGLHVYDGHLSDLLDAQRRQAVQRAAEELGRLVGVLEDAGNPVGEVTTGGTHTFIETIASRWTLPDHTRLTVGAGTVVYSDVRSLGRLGDALPFEAAAGILSRVVGNGKGRLTLDAGLTAIQVDAGRPHAEVVGHPELAVRSVSQEHLVLDAPDDSRLRVGELLVLLPRHIDTALAQFPTAFVVSETSPDGGLVRVPLIGRWAADGT